MKQSSQRGRIGWLFLLPSLLGVGAFYVIPFGGTLFYTFTEGIANVRFVGLSNFSNLLGNPTFLLAAQNTGLFLLCGLPLLMAAALGLSLLLGNGRHSLTRWALLLPMAAPVAAFALGWEFLLGDGGPVNSLLGLFGLGSVNFFDNSHAFGLLLLVYLVKNIGYLTVIFTSAIGSLPSEYREAYLLDSDAQWPYIRRILLPLIAPMLFFGLVVSVMNGFKIFREIYAFYGDAPPNSVYMLQHFMNNTFHKLNYQRLCTAAFLVVAGISVFVWLCLKLQNRVHAQ